MARESDARQTAADEGAIELLVEVLQSGTDLSRSNAAAALGCIAESVRGTSSTVVGANVLPVLIRMI